MSAQNMRSRNRAELERMSCPRKLSVDGSAVGARASSARSADNQPAPTAGSDRNAAAMIGLMVEPGIAS